HRGDLARREPPDHPGHDGRCGYPHRQEIHPHLPAQARAAGESQRAERTMRKHVFIARPANVSPRWLEAFPDALITSAKPDLGTDGAFVGLSAELPDWRTRLAALVATPGRDVVLLSLQPDDGEALAAFELGARGYAHALATAEMLREVDAVVAHGGL